MTGQRKISTPGGAWLVHTDRADVVTSLCVGVSVEPTGHVEKALARGMTEGLETDDEKEVFVGAGADIPPGILRFKKDAAGAWTGRHTGDTAPAVLGKAAVKAGAMPRAGMSALPPALESVVPETHRYWLEADPVTARAKRDALADSGFLDSEKVKWVDGELRLTVPVFHLYEPGDTPEEIGGPTLQEAIDRILGAKDAAPILDGADPDPTIAALAGTEKAIVAFDETATRLVDRIAKGEIDSPWLLAAVDDATARLAFATVGHPFLFHVAKARVVAVASFPPATRAGITWITKADGPPIKRIDFQGVPVQIDRPAGTVQQGTADDGTAWTRTYKLDYGYIEGLGGGDGDSLDVFVGPDLSAPVVYVCEQTHPDGSFDELKAMVGFADEAAARSAYADHIPVKLLSAVHTMPVQILQALAGARPAPRVSALAAESSSAGNSAENAREKALSKRLEGRHVRVLKSDNAEERYVFGVVLEPDVVDAQNDTYDAPTIRATAHRYMERFQNIGLMHKGLVNDKVKILESFLAPVDMEIDGQAVRKGSWMLGARVLDDTLWSAVKQGEITGFSIGGNAVRKPVDETT